MKTRPAFTNESMFELISLIEHTYVEEALLNNGQIVATQENLNQFQRNDVWDLVVKPPQKNIIRIK